MELVIALDLPTKKENIALANSLKEFSIWLKVGFRSYIRDGKSLIEELKKINPNFKIFLDLKLYDIPNTMADASMEIANLGVDMFNIHASSGKEAMQTIMQRLEKIKNRPLVFAVTALTSFNENSFKNIYNKTIEEQALYFAKTGYQNGLDGVVCSAFESKNIKNETSKEFLTLSPAIRPFNEESFDQKRVANLEFASKELVDFPVIGRPIYKDNNPKDKVKKILKTIEKLKK